MQVDERLIENLANLARLELSGAEKLEMMKDLNQMIAFVDQLNQIDTTGVVPAIFMGEHSDIYRKEDVAGNMLTTAEALQPAAVYHPPFFTVPKVIRRD